MVKSEVIKRMRERLKPGPSSSSLSSGLGTRLTHPINMGILVFLFSCDFRDLVVIIRTPQPANGGKVKVTVNKLVNNTVGYRRQNMSGADWPLKYWGNCGANMREFMVH